MKIVYFFLKVYPSLKLLTGLISEIMISLEQYSEVLQITGKAFALMI